MTEPYTLYNGDCFDFLPTIPDGSVDLLLTDPPYGITACSWDVVPDIPRFWREAWRVLKPNGACVIFGTVKNGIDWITASRKEFRYDLIWKKPCASMFIKAGEMPLRLHETIFVFYRKRPTYNPLYYKTEKSKPYKRHRGPHRCVCFTGIKAQFKEYTGEILYKSLLEFSNFNGAGFDKDHSHPTQKPVDLMKHLIETYSNPDETVLDPFMGSGSTGVAAMMTGRKFLGSELDTHFFEVSKHRIAEAPRPPEHGEVVLVKPNDAQGYLTFGDAEGEA